MGRDFSLTKIISRQTIIFIDKKCLEFLTKWSILTDLLQSRSDSFIKDHKNTE